MNALMVVALCAGLSAATSAATLEAAATPEVSSEKPQPKPGRFFVHANMAFNAYTFLGAPYAGGNEDLHDEGVRPRCRTDDRPGLRSGRRGASTAASMFFKDRVTAAVSPAVIVGYRF